MTAKDKNPTDEKTKVISQLQKAASIMGQAGGSKGGLISAKRLTPRQRKDRSRRAIAARWKKRKNKIVLDNNKTV